MSPVRPWEWDAIDAYDWNLAKDIQRARNEGLADGHRDKAETAQGDKATADKLAQRAGGR